MAESPTDELRMLRQRAYGPDADIHDDPAALARLRELEERRAAVTPGAADEPPASADASASSAPRAVADDSAVEADAPASAGPEVARGPEPIGAPAARPRLRRRTVWLWAASLVLAAIVGAWTALALPAAGVGRVAVLAEAPIENWPTGFFGERSEDGMSFEPYLGLTVLTIPNDPGAGSAGTSCLVVVHGMTDNGSFGATGGLSGTGCGAGRFEAQAMATVTEAMPDELVERHPVGTALLFVLKGSEVHVFADSSTAGGPTDAGQ